jgi:iron complex outermembrane recepter protein
MCIFGRNFPVSRYVVNDMNMKRLIIIMILFAFVADVAAQAKRGGKVKRKYRNVEAVNENIPEVFVHGRVRNLEREAIQGATVVVRGTLLNVNTNEDGEYFLKGLSTGINSIMVSHVGYKTKIIDYQLKEGNNDVYFTLDRDRIILEPVTVTAQQREQQLLDIPATMSTLSGKMLETAQIREMEQIADFVPGMNARIQTPHRPSFVIRGLTSDEVSPNAQPRVSVYFNQVPVSRASMAVTELYDMERVEVMKGPQGTLFGRGAQAGAISFITRKPVPELGGYLTAGLGDYGQKEVQGALNLPLFNNNLIMRASGIYNYRDGYVENTFGGALNGKNTIGGRFSLRITPSRRTKIDLVVNYQSDDNPGTAFMSKRFPNVNGVNDIFMYQASLEQGENLFNNREVLGASMDIKHFRNENSYWSSLTSYYTNNAGSRWDGDGTQAPAIDMAESVDVVQYTQEVRYNFSRKSKTNGFIGAGYWREDVNQTYWFGPNEQHMAYLFMQMPEFLVSPDGAAIPMTALPVNPALGPLSGMPLPSSHEEENYSSANNQAIDLFGDATWKLRPRLSFTAGLRGTYERFAVTNESVMTGGSPSVLGMLLENDPNLFFRPVSLTEVEKSYLSYTGRVNLKHDFNSYSNVFMGYARGRRPNVIQFNSTGQSEIMKQEVLHSFDAGFKWSLQQRFWLDVGTFYQLYRNFQTTAWDSVSVNYLIRDGGMATSYGAEVTVKAALLQNLDFFGNYAWINARFDSLDVNGNAMEYAGNSFRLTPEHSFSAGIHLRINITRGLEAFLVPVYSWKSHIWFEDANTPGLEQSGYGLLNARAGIEMEKQRLTISINSTNLLNEQYIISAGNTGTMFGVPTFVPGAPRLLGTRLTWRF